MVARLQLPKTGVPERCSCGYVSEDTVSMITHLIDSGCVVQARDGLHLDASITHRKEKSLGNNVVPEVPADGQGDPVPLRRDLSEGGGGVREKELVVHLVPDRGHVAGDTLPPDYTLPWWSHTYWSLAARFIFHMMTVFVVMFLSVVAGFVAVPVVLMPLLNGPLAPWGPVLAWLWGHGEVSTPVALMVLAAFVWGRTRWRIQLILEDVLIWGTVGVIGSVILGALAWAVWKLWPLVWR